MEKVIAKKKSRRFHLSLERKQSLYGYLFCAPIIIGFAILYIPVTVQSIIFSFSDISFQAGTGMVTTWTGWDNYQAVLSEDGGGFFRTVLSATLSLIPQIFVVLIFAFFMANILNQNFRGRTVARVIFFIPVIMSSGIISYFDKQQSMVDTYSNQGKLDISAGGGLDLSDFREVIANAVGNETLTGIITGAVDGIYTVITSAGVQMLVFLSGLQSISINMYEAAKVEGATGWEVFWKISFPMISPLILVNLLYTIIDLFLTSDNAAVQYIKAAMESSSQYAEASALSWIYTVVVLAFVGIAFLLVKKLVVYQD